MVANFRPPDTPMTESLRSLWEALPSNNRPPFEAWYADSRHLYGPSTPNAQALAAVLFDRALMYWPNFFRPTDSPAVWAWAELIDDMIPLATPDDITAAVDAVAARGDGHGGPADFLHTARDLMTGGRN